LEADDSELGDEDDDTIAGLPMHTVTPVQKAADLHKLTQHEEAVEVKGEIEHLNETGDIDNLYLSTIRDSAGDTQADTSRVIERPHLTTIIEELEGQDQDPSIRLEAENSEIDDDDDDNPEGMTAFEVSIPSLYIDGRDAVSDALNIGTEQLEAELAQDELAFQKYFAFQRNQLEFEKYLNSDKGSDDDDSTEEVKGDSNNLSLIIEELQGIRGVSSGAGVF